MNEQIKINVPDGYHAVQRPDGVIDILLGDAPRGPQSVLTSGLTFWSYEGYTAAHGWEEMAGYATTSARPEPGPTVRNVRMRRTLTVIVYGDTEEEVGYGVDTIKEAVASINAPEGR